MKSSITVGTGAAVELAMNENFSLPLASSIQEQTHLWGLGTQQWTSSLCGGVREWVCSVGDNRGIITQASDGKTEVRYHCAERSVPPPCFFKLFE